MTLSKFPAYVRPLPRGGDIADCLSSDDINAVTRHLCNTNLAICDAIAFYNARTKTSSTDAEALGKELRSALQHHRHVLLPVHVRHHWASAVLTLQPSGRIQIIVYDSCPSMTTAKDMHHVFARMCLTRSDSELTFMSHGRQPRDSVECGLHVILIGMALRYGKLRSTPLPRNEPLPQASLNGWRRILEPVVNQDGALSPARLHELVAAAPEACALVNISVDAFPDGAHPSASANPNNAIEGGAQSAAAPLRPFVTLCTAKCPSLPRQKKQRTASSTRDPRHIDDPTVFDADAMESHDVELEFPLDRADWLAAAATEADKERLNVCFAVDGTPSSLALRTLPEELLADATFMAPLRTRSRLAYEADVEQLKRQTNLALTKVFGHGAKLDTSLVDSLLEQVVRHPLIRPDWCAVSTQQLAQVQRRGSVAKSVPLRPDTNVMCVGYEQLTDSPDSGHFIAMYYTEKSIRVVDSLIDQKPPAWPRQSTRSLISAFAELLRAHGRPVSDTVELMKSDLQDSNECGIFAINNLVRAATGQSGRLNRRQFLLAHAKMLHPSEYPFDLVPPRERQDMRKAQAPTVPKPCCGLKKIDPDGFWCSEHHPLALALSVRHTCSRKAASSKTRCQREAIGIAGVEWTCAFHASESELTLVRDFLRGLDVQLGVERLRVAAAAAARAAAEAPPPRRGRPPATFVHEPYQPVLAPRDTPAAPPLPPEGPAPMAQLSVGDGKTPMPTTVVRRTISGEPIGAVFEITSSHEHEKKHRWRGKVVARTREPASISLEVSHKFCGVCDQWHACPDAPARLVPTPKAHYFGIARAEGDDPPIVDDCDVDELGSDFGDDELPLTDDEAEAARDGMLELDLEREPLFNDLPAGSTDAPALRDALSWVWREVDPADPDRKPPSVHRINWRTYAVKTRDQHRRYLTWIRLAAQDPAWASLPLGKGVVELIMRLSHKRKWKWSTISTTYASVATALKQLEMYTLSQGIDLSDDHYFNTAKKRAVQNARQQALRPKKSAPLSESDYKSLLKELGPSNAEARALLALTWHLAGRIGDVRRLQPANFEFQNRVEPDTADAVPFKVTYVEGKGVAFWGLYTIHATLPEAEVKALRGHLATRSPHQHAFSQAAQRAVAKAVNAIPDHSVRSLRRGALVYLARCGVPDVHLQNLSGHRRKDTLMRYLGWGVESSEAADSAKLRAQLVHRTIPEGSGLGPRGGGRHAPYDGSRYAQKMGPYSGYGGDRRGRRTEPPPQLFSYQPPSRQALGLGRRDDNPEWPLHVKRVTLLDLDGISSQVECTELRNYMQECVKWISSSQHYGITWDELIEQQVPVSRFTDEQILRMLEYDKLAPLTDGASLRCGVKGFTVPQPAKQRHRPVFEPLNNSVIDRDHVPPIKYPSRRERRCALSNKRYFAQFDWAAYFDQFQLSAEVQDCYVVRTPNPVEWQGQSHRLFALTRVPMGATYAAQVAQTTTWAIMEPLFKLDVALVSMIDNVAIGSDNPDDFVTAVQLFVRRCDEFNTTLNERDEIPSDPEEILQWGRTSALGPTTFLGEVYQDGTVRNADKNVEKFHEAYERIRISITDTSVIVTRRNMAAIIGLALWMAHTIDVPLQEHFELMRTFSAIEARRSGWDDPIRVTPPMLDALAAMAGPLLRNHPVAPQSRPAVDTDLTSYNTVIVVDASADGFGAFIYHGGVTYRYNEGWREKMFHSAWAEPLAATLIVQWARRTFPDAGRIALVTDHIAMAKGQRRPLSGNGGFSRAYYLNRFFQELYSDCDSHQVFFIKGVNNQADKPSRELALQSPPRWTVVRNVTLPKLCELYHPYAGRGHDRLFWQV